MLILIVWAVGLKGHLSVQLPGPLEGVWFGKEVHNRGTVWVSHPERVQKRVQKPISEPKMMVMHTCACSEPQG